MTSNHRDHVTLVERLCEAVQMLGERLLGREPGPLALATAPPVARAPRHAALRAVAVSEWREAPRPRVAAAWRDRRSGGDRRRRDVGAPYGVERRSGIDPRKPSGGR